MLLETNGTTLYYEVKGDGHPVVLIHAGIADHRMWDEQFSPFAEKYRVVRYDVRGFTKSPSPPNIAYTDHDDLWAILDCLNIEKAVLIGCSNGGRIAIDFALAYPERVSGLVLIGAAVGGFEDYSPEAIEEFNKFDEALERGDLDGAVQADIDTWVIGPKRTAAMVDSKIIEKVRLMEREALQNTLPEEGKRRPLDPPAITRLSEIHVPTLILIGDQDQPDFVRLSSHIETSLPNAKRFVLEGTAHLPSMEHPNKFNQLTLEFLESIY